MTGKIIPLGYSTPGARERLDELMRDPMTYLVDIRYSTVSKKKPEWSEAILSDRYDGYMWIKSLGNLNYFTHGPIKIAKPEVGIPRLVNGLKQGYNLVLLCTCAHYETCHRKVVVELVKEQLPDIEVVQPDTTVAIPEDSIPALSIWQPWTFLLSHGYKDIENREWSTSYRGPVLLHASAKVDDWFYPARHEKKGQIYTSLADRYGLRDVMPSHKVDYPTRAIVGIADLVDVVTESDSPWFFGTYGFVLENARPFEPIPYKGSFKLFNIPKSVVAEALESVKV